MTDPSGSVPPRQTVAGATVGSPRSAPPARATPDHADEVTVRRANLPGADRDHVARLVGAYLWQTEREKADHLGLALPRDGQLPRSYQAEIARPERAFADAVVFLAELNGAPVGVAVAKPEAGATEIKRLWADPQVRGRGVGSALIDAVLHATPGAVRLTVWNWRTQAQRLYRSRRFTVVPSWDPRPDLVCMLRP
jgi:GNAT superfamily N-acetyltransferase